MSFTSSSRASSPLSSSGLRSPDTARSILFDDLEGQEAPLDSATRNFILVTGGLGYIGSHTSWELLKAGFNVVIVDNLSKSFRNVLEKVDDLRTSRFGLKPGQPALHFYEADYRDQRTMRNILSKYSRKLEHQALPMENGNTTHSTITGVIHFAAYKAVAKSFQTPLEYYANNVSGMVDFCALLNEFGIKTFVLSSSATVYGELANERSRLLESDCDNRSCRGLTNPYGRTKWMCEAILQDLAESDAEWSITALRYFNPIGCDESGQLGEDPRDTPDNLMPIVVKVMTGEIPQLNIYGADWQTPDGTAIRDFIHISDLARGHVDSLIARQKPGCGFDAFNLGTGTGHSVMEFVTTMERVSGRPIRRKVVGRREGDVGMCIGELTKTVKTFGWMPQKTLEDCCRDICGFIGLRS